MPLSDREQQILQEIERHLYEQDPKFAQQVATKTFRNTSARDFRRGVLLFLAGLGALVGFFLKTWVWVGVLAFAMMLGGAVLAYHNGRKLGGESLRRPGRPSPFAKVSRFFGNLEDRMRNSRKGDDA